MNRKIKLIGVRNIPLAEDTEIKPDTDYVLALKVARVSEEKLDGHGTEAEEVMLYKMKTINVEMLQEVGASPIKIQKGFTPSQRMRFCINDLLTRKGEIVNEENYEKITQNIMDWLNSKYV